MQARFLLIAPQGLGDSLQATPLLPGLRERYPAARIDVIALRPTSGNLFRGLTGLVDNVYHLPYWTKGKFAFALALLRFVVWHSYDASFLAYPAARWEYQLMHALVRSRARLAHDYDGPWLLDRVPGFRTRRLQPGTARSNVARNGDLLQSALPGTPLAATYRIPPAWTGRPVDERLAGAVIVHVGSIDHDSFAAKRWPLDRFSAFAGRMVAHGARVVFLSGPDEREDTRAAHAATPGSELFEGPIEETASLLARAALVVTNDSGIGHLAVAAGRPTISLFGPTPIEFAPYGPTASPLRPTACPPCFDILTSDMTCKLHIDYACLRRDLTVDLVEQTALSLLTPVATPAPNT
jgi:ADP-heptose:LPS heptosyltransferase